MYHLVARQRADETLHWEYAAGRPGAEEGLRIVTYFPWEHVEPRVAVRAFAKLILATETWLTIERNEWVLDLDKLKASFGLDERTQGRLAWLRGVVRVQPDVKHEGHSDELFTEHQRSTTLTISIYRSDLEQLVVEDPIRRGRVFDERRFHHVIAMACRRSFVDGHLDEAVRRATLSFFAEVRTRTGLTDDGTTLVASVFSPKNPLIRVNHGTDQSAESEREGVHRLAMGMSSAFRNPVAHKLDAVTDELRALEILGLVSLLFRYLDDAAAIANMSQTPP